MLFRILLLRLMISTVVAQPLTTAKSIEAKADSLYRAKSYKLCAPYYIQLASVTDYKSKRAAAYYNAACCLALQGEKDSALPYLKMALDEGYHNKENMLTDTDLTSLHATAAWPVLVSRLAAAKTPNTDPGKARFITDDIYNFWTAWEKAYQDTSHFREIFKAAYFDKASPGMEDYMALKVDGIDELVAHVRSAPRFYKSIKGSTLSVDQFKPQFKTAFQNLKRIYPAAVFPDVVFVMGALTSGGTVSSNGLLLGINQASLTDTTVTDELSPRQKTRLSSLALLPNVVAHESIHFQQNGITNDTITLGYAINEGMADFIGELISGKTGNVALFEWAKGKEQLIWNRFTADMYLNRYNNWIANSKQSGPDSPPDQGYWVGYQICKAYYEQAKNKKQAIYDILHIQDYRKFLAQSGWEKKVAGM